MKIKNLNLVLLLVTILVIVPTMQIAYAQTLPTTWISEGVYPSSPSYVVWVESSHYYAKNNYGQTQVSGTNASTVINYALDNLPSYGGTVYLKAGVYYVDTTIRITHDYTYLTGDKGAIIWQSNNRNNTYIVLIESSHQFCRISELWIEGNGNNNVGSTAVCVSDHCWYITIDHCHILHWDIWGVYVQGYTGVINIHNNYITSTQYEDGSSGIFTSGMGDAHIQNNQIAGGNYSCIRITSCGYTFITGNKMFGTEKYYVYFDNVREMVMDGNVIGGGLPYGRDYVIYMIGYSANYNYGNIISNNVIYGAENATQGIRMHGILANNTITGNVFIEGFCSGNAIVEVDQCDYNLIEGNIFPEGTTNTLIGAHTIASDNIGCADYP